MAFGNKWLDSIFQEEDKSLSVMELAFQDEDESDDDAKMDLPLSNEEKMRQVQEYRSARLIQIQKELDENENESIEDVIKKCEQRRVVRFSFTN
ncbi:hypothetical protein TRICI_003282 [Trichomonascus ciferrii]|uniref:Uncharacterized protein n=1 Tax=Trichomonascus ciferrii TaxID=44093 RepID=A0A642V483_9ASCO|nr:hypothetical protein TRICI_003282 [Trichomonascus ciferrii]